MMWGILTGSWWLNMLFEGMANSLMVPLYGMLGGGDGGEPEE